MSAQILKNSIEIGNRLEELGQSKEKLTSVVEAMVSAKGDCTDNDPPGARGWSAWRMGTRRLREVNLLDADWEKDETDQVSSIVNRKLGVRIVVSNTDDATGLDGEGRGPQNRSKKGAATDRMILENQGSFLDVLDASVNVVPIAAHARQSGSIITWCLCVYSEGDDFRAELSCPDGVENGFFTGFVERILVIDSASGDVDPMRRKLDVDDEVTEGDEVTEFEIPVTRK